MKRTLSAFFLIILFVVACTSPKKNATTAAASSNSSMIKPSTFYEMRTYYAAPGKLDDLQARFRNNTMRIFVKHGMTNVGYWIPTDNPDNKLIYILAYPSSEAREASWKAFGSDPEWQAVAKASEANGKLVTKVESVFMQTTDYSPKLKIEAKNPPRLFELRTYTASDGNMQNLNDRFRNHTMKLFEKHGITNIAYWQPAPGQSSVKGDLLVYIIAHKDRATGDASWQAFKDDPTWVAAKSASEVKGGGSLTTKVESVFIMPTDYSPIK